MNIKKSSIIPFLFLNVITHNPIPYTTVYSVRQRSWVTHICVSKLITIGSDNEVNKWKHFFHCWPFVRGIHRSTVDSPHKGQWCRTLMFVWSAPEQTLKKQSRSRWFATPSRSLKRHCNTERITGDPVCSSLKNQCSLFWPPSTRNVPRSISVKHRSDAKVSDRCRLCYLGHSLLSYTQCMHASTRAGINANMCIFWRKSSRSPLYNYFVI